MNISALKENEIFIFGSNLAGNHAGGAAKQAKEDFGAEDGVGEGLTGTCYAFPTLDKNMQKRTHEDLLLSVKKLYNTARKNLDMEFILTKVGCGIAGYDEQYMKDLFNGFANIPDNIVFPKDWKTN